MADYSDITRRDYFDWLCKLFPAREDYTEALWFLFCSDFIPELDMDSNRASDGLDLRADFSDDMRISMFYIEDAMSPQCSMLELMVALAKRAEVNIISGEDYIPNLFWEMFDSLGFGDLTNDRWSVDEANRIVDRFNCRMYNKNGKGGLFTIRKRGLDMKDYDIWYQMHRYINELYSG